MTPFRAICYALFTGANYAIYLFLIITAFRSAMRFSMKKTLVILSVVFTIDLMLELLAFLYYIYGLASGHGGAEIQPATWGSLWNLTLLNACALVAYSSIIKMITYSYDKYEVSSRAEAASNQLIMEQGRYETLARHIGETDRLVHDMRHHMLSFRDFSERGDLQGLRRYLDGMGEAYQTEEMPIICARPTVDVILRHNLALALEADIEVEHQVEIPTEFDRSDLDLCIVFGNLMENALEACLRQTVGERFIHVNTDCIGGKMLAIRVENSFEGDLVWHSGICESVKRKGPGLGLRLREKRSGIEWRFLPIQGGKRRIYGGSVTEHLNE
ncbi:MAG: GHKL domain-containing protein [Oscillospiraceae bacterium]